MCSYITEQAAIFGSAKGPKGWFHVDTANVYFDHPFDAPLDHSLNIDFVNQAEGATQRVAVELSAESARALVEKILAALEAGAKQHLLPEQPQSQETSRVTELRAG
ncbi:MAG: DUF6295 family protein [Dehalococcoidia bacterium]|nr:DUF6295 family protein [Dehalococcoidia bacterium]